MEKEQKQELGWRVSVLPIPAFHCIYCVHATHNHIMTQWWNAGMGNNQIPSIPILVSVLFPSLRLTATLHCFYAHADSLSETTPGQEKHFGILFIPPVL